MGALNRVRKAAGNTVGKVAGIGAFAPGEVGSAFAAISVAGYATAGNWREAGKGAIALGAGLIGGKLVDRLGEEVWQYAGSRVTRRAVQRGLSRYGYARGAAYNLLTLMH